MIDLEDFGTLAHGYSDEFLLAHLEISRQTLARYRSGETQPPKAVRWLLRYMNWGQLEALGGKEWEGFTINKRDHTLHIPGFSENRTGFTTGNLKTLFFQVSYIPRMEAEIRQAKREAEAQKNDIRALTIANDFYKHQLREAGKRYSVAPKL